MGTRFWHFQSVQFQPSAMFSFLVKIIIVAALLESIAGFKYPKEIRKWEVLRKSFTD